MISQVSPRSFALAAMLLCACGQGTFDPASELAPTTPVGPLPENVAFQLNAEISGSACVATDSIDVNLGQTPETFVRAAYCQINGTEPAADVVTMWAQQLRTTAWVRRIDVVHSLCASAKTATACALTYSDPWQEQVLLTTPCVRKTKRDVGAIMMFFSQCPDGVNCDMDWANTHVSGMQTPHRLYAFGDATQGYYDPDNAGFWKRELLDAAWSGLQFVLPNVYGPDMGQLAGLSAALADVGAAVGVGLMDDTSGWNAQSKAPWNTVPSFNDTEGAAQSIYKAKWKPFFTEIAHQYWYLIKGRPLIYFYNAGTLTPTNKSAATVARLKQLFKADFGVEPFVSVDTAYFADPGMSAVADSRFIWKTVNPIKASHFDIAGVTQDHFMVKWDPLGRDSAGSIATATDGILKGPELLDQALTQSAASDLVVFATWNDLGEGTGINRNYDYYYQGQWLTPNAFMSILRKAQCN